MTEAIGFYTNGRFLATSDMPKDGSAFATAKTLRDLGWRNWSEDIDRLQLYSVFEDGRRRAQGFCTKDCTQVGARIYVWLSPDERDAGKTHEDIAREECLALKRAAEPYGDLDIDPNDIAILETRPIDGEPVPIYRLAPNATRRPK